jgi:hypothetical protein
MKMKLKKEIKLKKNRRENGKKMEGAELIIKSKSFSSIEVI